MRHITGLNICFLVLVISLDSGNTRWIDDEAGLVEIPMKRAIGRTHSNRDGMRRPGHFINMERQKKRVGIAGLDNMDIMTSILEEVRQKGGSYNLRRKGESPTHDIVLNDLRKLLESAGKRR